MSDLIVPGLYIGDVADAPSFDGPIICVLENLPPGEPKHAVHVPICRVRPDGDLRTSTGHLELAAKAIEDLLKKGKVLVHCAAGIERSPLAVAWFLHTRRGIGMHDAYELIIKARPEVIDRSSWIADHGPMNECRWCDNQMTAHEFYEWFKAIHGDMLDALADTTKE